MCNYLATDMHTAYKNNIKEHFIQHFKRFINITTKEITTNKSILYQLLNNEECSQIFKNPDIDNESIVISLENLGWVQKEPLTSHYVNWIGDIYNGEVFERKWRDYYFWQPYTKEQMDSLVKLCDKIFEETTIQYQIIGHNTKITDFHKYEGLLTRSNFDVSFTDVSPAFNFEDFIKKIENE
jgi:hypothetical protein